MIPASDPAQAVSAADPSAARDCAKILVPVTLTTAFADYVFWDGRLGLSVGVFFAGLGLLVLAHQAGRPRRLTLVFALLLAATCAQTAIDLTLSGSVIAATLTLALAGQVFQPQLSGIWARFSEALYGVVTAPRRWAGVSGTMARLANSIRARESYWGETVSFAWRAMFPAMVLLVIFAAIFAAGNAVFGDLLQRANGAIFDLWGNLNVTPLRVIWWILAATLALGIFHRSPAPGEPRWWTLTVPRISRRDERLARWQTGAALVAMNGLFCVVNTLDAIFIWGRAALPPGVGHSEFVHSGVNSLIMAVVLSAIVIAGMFQQADATAGKPWLKRLAYVWVLQNFILIGGVLRRLTLYTEAYQLTERRVYVGCFLVLVGAGFLLLAEFVRKRRSFNWLVGANAVATFGLFFILQFVDVAGAVARYNVARAEEGRSLDVDYLASLGASAWPELIRVSRSSRDAAARAQAKMFLAQIAETRLPKDWRACQWRDQKNHALVAAEVAAPFRKAN